MVKTYNTQPVLTALQTAKQVLILLPQNPKVDSVAAGLSLFLALSKAKLSTTIGCPTEMTVGFNRLFGVNILNYSPDIAAICKKTTCTLYGNFIQDIY